MKSSITDLAGYARRMDAGPQPSDRFILEITRSVRDWMLDDLRERQRNLLKAVADPNIKPGKRAKRQAELYEITETVTALERAKQKILQ